MVVGAHLDSIGSSPTGRSPGADDDGSGTVVVLEALRVLAASGIRPQNTIEFHWYAAEEVGLLGSQDVWASYKAAGRSVVGYLNQDMAGYSPTGVPAVFQDYVDAGLTRYVTALIGDYLHVKPGTSKCGYGCSDHASARANGFREFVCSSIRGQGSVVLSAAAAAFVAEDTFENSNKYIHSANDVSASVL